MTLGQFFASVNPYVTPLGAWLAIALSARALIKDVRTAPSLEIVDVTVAGDSYTREDVESIVTDDDGNLREGARFVFVPIHVKVRNVGRGPAGRVVVLTQNPSNGQDKYDAAHAQTLLAGDPAIIFECTMPAIRQHDGTVVYAFELWAIADNGAAVSRRTHSLTNEDKMSVAADSQVRWSRLRTKFARWDARFFTWSIRTRRQAKLFKHHHPLHTAMMHREAVLRNMHILV